MLELKSVSKEYPAGNDVVHALKSVDLRFRHSEFVSILGPSGCGKTTLLNIIGGLDKYTDGDLIINGRSTKEYKARDWDAYRNHSIGFVFQSYHLIPHQTVLRNVELALTLSGVPKEERRKRAIKALEDVGLGDQLKKRPGEMSGGQMQRVAIARALVNDPDIILADEPTGALDTETSVQVMEILKKISEDKLIIMVTHNPELAERYSSRIIRILDGRITDDSAPLTEEEAAAEKTRDEKLLTERKGQKMPSMSFGTAFGLSLKNLLTKKGRTLLTSFAGSIGIIGIALILSISTGVTAYINHVQEESLASYPLTIETTVMDFSSLVETMLGSDSASDTPEHARDAVYTKPIFSDLVNSMSASNQKTNDLGSFKEYIEEERAKKGSDLNTALSAVHYEYDLKIGLYTKNTEDNIIKADPTQLMQSIMGEVMGVDMTAMGNARDNYMANMSGMFSRSVDLLSEMLEGSNGQTISSLITDNYELLYGSFPQEYNEILLVLNENNELDDLSLYALGLKSHAEMSEMMKSAMKQADVAYDDRSWSYEELCNKEFKVILNPDCYTKNEKGVYSDLRESDTGLRFLYERGIDIKISGIVRPKEDSDAKLIHTTLAYTHELTDYIIEQTKDAPAIAEQLANKDTDIITGLPFPKDVDDTTVAEKKQLFMEYVERLNSSDKIKLLTDILSIPTEEEINEMANQIKSMSQDELIQMFMQMVGSRFGMDSASVRSYITSMSEEDFNNALIPALREQIGVQKREIVEEKVRKMNDRALDRNLNKAISDASDEQIAEWYDTVVPQNKSDSSYEYNLEKLGYVDVTKPERISLYTATFKNKDLITNAIETYNNSHDEDHRIDYTDYIGMLLSNITSIINAITYVLIAFVGISLVVSSIMIGIITLISVQERTKEIGILRAIGASKHDVSSMFNAETMIIGFASGVLGVVVTMLLCIPTNLIVQSLTEIKDLNAYLPPIAAVILVAISVLLTLISGLIPSRSAAKKDPVVALRTE